MKVEIYSYSIDDKKYELDETWTLDHNGHAICDNAFEQESMGIHGITHEGRFYYPKDGEEFLRYLPWEYAGSSLTHAVIVK
jgi:hypothetical protein